MIIDYISFILFNYGYPIAVFICKITTNALEIQVDYFEVANSLPYVLNFYKRIRAFMILENSSYFEIPKELLSH